ncbi:phage portal protein [Corynebacterium urealyticum]|uniref:phage portal protein n=1 Tax=Corynebacterium urealyticum TaxID=43771 RepID=UPI001910E606|nr:phage portal protein [Corynebacterium urealyticum]QQE51613.1 phage portal protein [Corynebacterium urealyticum]
MSTLTPHETALTQRLLSQLAGFQSANRNHEQYYAGTFKPRYLGIGLPEIAKNLEMVAGWPATTVDVLEERLDILGWTNDDLGAVFADNALDVEASQVHLDSLIYGTAFVSVTAGNGDDEPEVLVLGHDAKTTTGYYNPRTRRLDAAITKTVSPDGETVEATLWGPHELVVSRRENDTSPWEVTNRIRHGFRRVPMIPFINRPRVGDRKGRSEISRAVRRYTDSAVRALTSMDVTGSSSAPHSATPSASPRKTSPTPPATGRIPGKRSLAVSGQCPVPRKASPKPSSASSTQSALAPTSSRSRG